MMQPMQGAGRQTGRERGVDWMDCPDCGNGKDYWNQSQPCTICQGRMRIPVDMSRRGMINAGLLKEAD